MSKLNYDLLPATLRSGLRNYIEQSYAPGSFLESVLTNNLHEACVCADDQNRYLLWDIVSWLRSDAPSICWGSRQRYDSWLNRRQVP